MKILSNKYVLFLAFFVSSILLLAASFELRYKNKIYPNVYVLDIKLSGKTQEQAESSLADRLKKPEEIVLISNSQGVSLLLDEIEFDYDFQETAKIAFTSHRSGRFLSNTISRMSSLWKKTNIHPSVNYDPNKLDEYVLVVSEQIAQSPILPTVSVVDDVVRVNTGKPGNEIDTDVLKGTILNNLRSGNFEKIDFPIKIIDPSLSETEKENFLNRAEKLAGKQIVLVYDSRFFFIRSNDLLSTLAPDDDYYDDKIALLVKNISKNINQNSQDAVFVFENGTVKEFAPARDQLTVNEEQLTNMIREKVSVLESVEDLKTSIEIPVSIVSPKTSTESVNNLGIKTLIGKGSSKFSGSISSRIHNIGLASSTLHGILVPPGEIFSTNGSLGDVSILTGYKQAYIIKDGQTMLGDGGGVCQVSTTLFRAALDAGLPIIERRSHSYRVAYYEQDSKPGIDATVYSPTTDFRFKNDTPGHVLIQSYFDGKNATLSFELYGTDDGRISKISTPIVTDVVPPPEDLYIDDPNLPMGIIKQIDYKSWGAKASFNYTVERDGGIIYEKTFKSSYEPWQAKFLRGTGEIH